MFPFLFLSSILLKLLLSFYILCTHYLPPSCLAHSVSPPPPRTAIRTTLIERFSPSALNHRFHYSFLLIISAARAPPCSPFIKNFSVGGSSEGALPTGFSHFSSRRLKYEVTMSQICTFVHFLKCHCVEISKFNEQCGSFTTVNNVANSPTCVSENKVSFFLPIVTCEIYHSLMA